MRTHIRGTTTTLAACIKITRRDGTILGAIGPSQSKFLYSDGVIYEPVFGIDASAIEASLGDSVSNLQIVGFLDDPRLKAGDIRNRMYDAADVEVFIVNHRDASMGRIMLLKGQIGAIKLSDGTYTISLDNLMARLSQQVLPVSSSTCRSTIFGGEGPFPCRPGDSAWILAKQHTSPILTVSDNQKVIAFSGLGVATGGFNYGKFTPQSGLNQNLVKKIKSSILDPDTLITSITFHEEYYYDLVPGIEVLLEEGCDRTWQRCGQHGNRDNFQAEPFIAGMDIVLEAPRKS
jgi:uncharacterized phage protein (TIGR02218 family)